MVKKITKDLMTKNEFNQRKKCSIKVLKESFEEQNDLSLLPLLIKNLEANRVIPLQSVFSNGTIGLKSPIEEQDLGERVSPHSKQHSMRKSRVSGELEKDMALPIGQSSTKFSTAMPLNPVTPLRWKSTKRIESEKKKLQEEIKTKEVVKENMNMKLAKEENEDQSKMAMASTRVNGIETPNKMDMPTSNHFTSQEDEMFTSLESTSKSTGMTSIDKKVEDQKHSYPIANGGNNECVKHCEEVSSLNAKHGTDQAIGDTSRTNRKPLPGDESTAITIDFLRARLLAERASSKAAKEHIQQLTQKVQELESRLNQEIQSTQKAKEVEKEALMKVESFTECKVSLPSMNEALFQHEKTKLDHQVQEVDQVDGKCQMSTNMEDTKSTVILDIKPSLIQSTSLEVNELVVSEVEAIPTFEQEKDGHQCVQSFNKNESLDIKQNGISIVPSIASTIGDSYSPTNLELKQEETRLRREERLHYMWSQMVKEMSIVVEDKTTDDHIQEGLLKWMHQFPSVVQNILPKSFEEKNLVPETKTKNVQQKGGDISLENLDLHQAMISKEETMEDCLMDGALYGDGSETHIKSLKKVASLIERFETNERIQREWEQSTAKQTSMNRQHNNEGSPSQTNSNCGTPLPIQPQQTHLREIIANEPSKCLLQVEDPSHSSRAIDSLISPQESMTTEDLLRTTEDLLITRHNDRMSTYTLCDSTPSTYPNSPIVGDKVRRSSGDRITPIITHGTLDPNLEQTKFGLQGTMDASFITPLLLSPSSRPRVWEKRGDISMDGSQLLKQNNHQRAFDGNCLTPRSHSERSSGEIGEPARSQALIGWIKEEEVHRSPALIDTGDHSSLQWDASIRGHHLQHEHLVPYSQAGNSNAYIRPGHYPVRNDEREIYRGRMESVSRSMEGLGSSWRSLSDSEGDETQLFVDTSDAITLSTSRRSDLQMPFQENGGSGRSSYCQSENMEMASKSYAYSGQGIPRENFRSRSTSGKIESTSSKVNEVLKALQLAKLSIQGSKTRRSTISSEHSYATSDRQNLRTDYGFCNGRVSDETPTTLPTWQHPKILRRHSMGTFRGKGSTTSHVHPSNSMPFGVLLDSHRNYPEDKYLMRRS